MERQRDLCIAQLVGSTVTIQLLLVLGVGSCHPELCLLVSTFLCCFAEEGAQQNMKQHLLSEEINGRCDPAKTAYVGQSWARVKWNQAYGAVGV